MDNTLTYKDITTVIVNGQPIELCGIRDNVLLNKLALFCWRNKFYDYYNQIYQTIVSLLGANSKHFIAECDSYKAVISELFVYSKYHDGPSFLSMQEHAADDNVIYVNMKEIEFILITEMVIRDDDFLYFSRIERFASLIDSIGSIKQIESLSSINSINSPSSIKQENFDLLEYRKFLRYHEFGLLVELLDEHIYSLCKDLHGKILPIENVVKILGKNYNLTVEQENYIYDKYPDKFSPKAYFRRI